MTFRDLLRHGTSLLVALAAAHAAAQVTDVTRPPSVVLSPPKTTAGSTAAPEIVEAAPASRIIVSGRPRPFVVVDGGSTVYVGDSYRGATLLEVRTDGAVWLRNGTREIDYGGGRVARLPLDSAGTGVRKPTTTNKQNNVIPGGSSR
jgi:hypothetical protein